MNATNKEQYDSESEIVLEAQDLTKKFGEVVAVNEVSVRVKNGELHSIIGPNGAGKTTFFNLIAGVLTPSKGHVYFCSEDVTESKIERRAQQGIGRSYQNNELFFDQTALENVRVAAQTSELGDFSWDMFSRASDFKRPEAEKLLDRVHLSKEQDTLAENLSHGDQRRLGIAVALATEPDVLLLDEPTSGMGPDATNRTAKLIENIRDEFGIAILIIEHDMSVVLDISDRITVLYDGNRLTTGTPEEVSADEEVQEAYLGGMKEEELDV